LSQIPKPHHQPASQVLRLALDRALGMLQKNEIRLDKAIEEGR
jgi:hypothetical protein